MDNNLEGPDHWFSENPESLKQWVESIHQSHQMMGSNIVKPTKKEIDNKREFQRVVVAKKDIKQGDTFTLDNLTTGRVPGGVGFPPVFMRQLINSKSSQTYKANQAVIL